MKLAHFADTHVGFRAYDKLTPDGTNRREADVADTFTRLVDAVIAVRPDVVVIAGDLFHDPRPSNNAVLCAFSNLSRLALALPESPIVLAAGNHDLAKLRGGGDILDLLTSIGIYVAGRSSQRFLFPRLGLSVLAVPDAPGLARPELARDPRAERNVLVLHGEVHGVTQGGADRRASLVDVSPEELGADAWHYCAFGHYHIYEQLGPNAAYSGSIDYTSSNIWPEAQTPKGFIVRDLDSGKQAFHAVEPSRRVIDLPMISAHELTSPEIDSALRTALESIEGGMDGAIVRLVVEGVSRDVGRALDGKALREFKRRCVHLNLDLRRPDVITVHGEHGQRIETVRKRRPSLTEMFIATISDAERFPLLADVDRGELAALGAKYLDQAGDVAPSELASTDLTKQLTDSLHRGAA
jgi:exonuclease SbcD